MLIAIMGDTFSQAMANQKKNELQTKIAIVSDYIHLIKKERV